MITARRAIVLLTGGVLAVAGIPATAQVSDTIVLNIMRECAKIDDPTARLACYDNNIRSAGAAPRSTPGRAPRPLGGGAPLQSTGPAGFGADDIKSPERFNAERDGPSEVTARVAASRERQPGVYLITLDSGAQWLFAESMPSNYRAPGKGDTVRIEKAALGSYMLMADHQQGVKVTRVK